MKRRTLLGAALLGAVATPALGAGMANAANPGPSVTRTGTTTLDSQAIYFVSYDGLVNNNSFQKNGLLTYKGYQYATWYTSTGNAVVARRVVGGSSWSNGHPLARPQGQRLPRRHLHGRVQDGRPAPHQHGLAQQRLLLREVRRRPHGQPGNHLLDVVRLRLRPDHASTASRSPPSSPTRSSSPPPRASSSSATGSASPATAATPSPSTTDVLDGARRVVQLDRHVHQRARLQHGPQHVPARHRLRRNGRLHSFFTWREQNGAVMCNSGGITNHDTGYVYSDRPGPHLAQRRRARSSPPPVARTRSPSPTADWSSTR